MQKIKDLELPAEIGLFLHLFLLEVSCSHFKHQDRRRKELYIFSLLDTSIAILKAVKPVKKKIISSIHESEDTGHIHS